MASLADLFVRVRGDTSDVTSKLKGVERSLSGMRQGLDGANVSTSKLQRVFGTLTTQLTGTNPAVARLSEVLGELVAGGPIVLGITAGAAAIAGAYRLITKGAREAAEAQAKLSAALVQQFKSSTGPNSETAKRFQAALQERADLTKKLAQLQEDRDNPLIATSFLGRKLYDSRIQAVQDQIKTLNEAIGNAMTGSIAKLDTVTVTATSHVKDLVGGFNELRELAGKVNAQLTQDNRNWWKGYIERTGEAIDITGRLEDKLIALLAKGTPLENLPGFGTAAGKPLELDIPSLVAPTVESAKQINDVAKENARMLSDTISNTAAQTASIIGNALVSFGSSRGNQIGGALGGSIGGGIGSYIGHQLTTEGGKFIGGALGSAVGSVIPVVGTLVGGLLGSALGGLFGQQKKEVRDNTNALRELTAELRNAPAGFKVASYRNNAAAAYRQLSTAERWRAARGATPLLGLP